MYVEHSYSNTLLRIRVAVYMVYNTNLTLGKLKII